MVKKNNDLYVHCLYISVFIRTLSETLQTGLPAGVYCDVISGQKEGNDCTGIKIQVAGDGTAYFNIHNSAEDPFVAIHVDGKL